MKYSAFFFYVDRGDAVSLLMLIMVLLILFDADRSAAGPC